MGKPNIGRVFSQKHKSVFNPFWFFPKSKHCNDNKTAKRCKENVWDNKCSGKKQSKYKQAGKNTSNNKRNFDP